MPFSPGVFRAQLVGSGARPNLFDLTFVFPAIVANAGQAGQLVTYMGRAASKPPAELGTIGNVNYFGRALHYPGDRVFPPWNLTVINDENFIVHNAFVNWSNLLNAFAGNVRDASASTPSAYMTDVLVNQYSKIGGSPIAQYKLVGAWPKTVGEIAYDWGTNDSIEEFPVTLEYQWWEDTSGNVTDTSSF